MEHRAVSYDWDLLKAACRESGLLETGGAFARACLANMLSGQNVAWFFLQCFWKHEKEFSTTEEAWRAAKKIFPWGQYGG